MTFGEPERIEPTLKGSNDNLHNGLSLPLLASRQQQTAEISTKPEACIFVTFFAVLARTPTMAEGKPFWDFVTGG